MKEKTKFVAFSTQKGGAGKTTLTVLAASYLHYVKGFNVAVIDCDYPQHSIVEMRERDLKLALEDEHYKRLAYEQFTRLQKKAYPVVESNTKEALADADYLLPQGDFDYVFFDLPGTINNEDLIHSLAGMDYLVAPISADRVVMESTLNYAVVVKEHIMGREKSRMKGLYMLWNMVDGREKTELYQVYEAVMKELGLPVLKTFLPDTKRFRREQHASRRSVFRSTLFPADRSLIRGSNLDKLVDEMCIRDRIGTLPFVPYLGYIPHIVDEADPVLSLIHISLPYSSKANIQICILNISSCAKKISFAPVMFLIMIMAMDIYITLVLTIIIIFILHLFSPLTFFNYFHYLIF